MSTPQESRTIDVSRIVGPTLKQALWPCSNIVPIILGLCLVPMSKWRTCAYVGGIFLVAFYYGVVLLICYLQTRGTQIGVDAEGVSRSQNGATQDAASWSEIHSIRYSKARYHWEEAVTMNLLDESGSTVLSALIPIELLDHKFAKLISELMNPDLVRQRESDRAAIQSIRNHVQGRETFDEDFFPGQPFQDGMRWAIRSAAFGFALGATALIVGGFINLLAKPKHGPFTVSDWIQVVAILFTSTGMWGFNNASQVWTSPFQSLRPRQDPAQLDRPELWKMPDPGEYRFVRPPIPVGWWTLQKRAFVEMRFGLALISVLFAISAASEFVQGSRPGGWLLLAFTVPAIWLAWIAHLSAERRARLLEGYWESFVVGEDRGWTVRMTDGRSAVFSRDEVWMTNGIEGTVTLGEGRNSIKMNLQLLERVKPS